MNNISNNNLKTKNIKQQRNNINSTSSNNNYFTYFSRCFN